MFENEKIKNGLKSFFLDLKEGEGFSYVHLQRFLVQNVAICNNCICFLFTCLWFLLSCICFLYRTIRCTFAYTHLTLVSVYCTVAYGYCTFDSVNCMDGA